LLIQSRTFALLFEPTGRAKRFGNLQPASTPRPLLLVRTCFIVGESLNSIFVDKIYLTSGAITRGNMTALPAMAGTRCTALVPLQ
jgi:hypothetical protein